MLKVWIWVDAVQVRLPLPLDFRLILGLVPPPGLSMSKVSLKKDGHYFCTHVSQTTVEAAGPEQLLDTEGEGNSDVAVCLSVCSAPGNM